MDQKIYPLIILRTWILYCLLISVLLRVSLSFSKWCIKLLFCVKQVIILNDFVVCIIVSRFLDQLFVFVGVYMGWILFQGRNSNMGKEKDRCTCY